MSKMAFYWWYAYGHFGPGDDDLPHLGQVFKYYRELRGWTKEELATILDCTVRYVEMLESPKNTKMPESLPRRKFIARVLGIPLVLMVGIPSFPDMKQEENTSRSFMDSFTIADPRTMTLYERMLTFCWEACYTSSFQRAAGDVAFCLTMLNESMKDAKGIQRDQLNAMRCRFYQLAGIIARDRLDFDQALKDGTQAVDLALELNNAELIAASLDHRSGSHARQKRYDLALLDIQRALPYADRSRSILRGNVYLVAAEKHMRVQGQRAEHEVMGFLDTVGSIVRKGHLEDDGSFLKLNVASLHIERAKILTQFHHFEDAHNSFKIAHKNLSPDLVSWQANILIEEAETCFQEEEIDGCCEQASRALKIVRTLQSRSREERIQRLYIRCRKRAPHNISVYRLGEALGPQGIVPYM